jgi:L-ascorbate metabolism protein UlaG (beta-lactamase superfamily)
MLAVVGGASAGVIHSLNEQEPQYICFFVSDSTKLKIKSEILPGLKYEPEHYDWIETKYPQNLMECYKVLVNDLPKIDIILISHNHYDHLDLPTLKILAARDKPIVLTGLGNKDLLDDKGFSGITELDWWQVYHMSPGGIKFIFVPSFHNSGRGLFDGDKSLWGGFVIEGANGRVYFAGDTAYGSFLQKVHDLFPDFRLTIFPVGNYEKRWIMRTQHMNPEDAVKAHILLNSKQSIGMHYATFLEHPEQISDLFVGLYEKADVIRARTADALEFIFS